jgi:hypothetical protein
MMSDKPTKQEYEGMINSGIQNQFNNDLLRLREEIKHKDAQIELLITIIDGCKEIATNVGDTYISEYISRFKKDVLNNVK